MNLLKFFILSLCALFISVTQNIHATDAINIEALLDKNGDLDKIISLVQNHSGDKPLRFGVMIGSMDPPQVAHMKLATEAINKGFVDAVLVYAAGDGAWNPDYKLSRSNLLFREQLLYAAALDLKHEKVLATRLAPETMQQELVNEDGTAKFGIEFVGIVGSDTAMWLANKDQDTNNFYRIARKYYMTGTKIPTRSYLEQKAENIVIDEDLMTIMKNDRDLAGTAVASDMALPVTSYLVFDRPGKPFDDATLLGKEVMKAGNELMDISSTQVRLLLKNNALKMEFEGLLTPTVYELIQYFKNTGITVKENNKKKVITLKY